MLSAEVEEFAWRRLVDLCHRAASLSTVFVPACQAESHRRRLNGSELIVQVIEGREFKDGIPTPGC